MLRPLSFLHITQNASLGHVTPPTVQSRDLAADGSAARLSIQAFPTHKIGSVGLSRKIWMSGSSLSSLSRAFNTELDEHWSGQGQSLSLDLSLVGRKLSDDTVLTAGALQKIHELLGVDDLVRAQRVPNRQEEALDRAFSAVKTIHRKLAAAELSLDQVTQERFNEMFGVKPVIVAAGLGTRFSVFVHKAFARSGLLKTNIGHAVRGPTVPQGCVGPSWWRKIYWGRKS